MISAEEKKLIKEITGKYGAEKVYIFGSSVKSDIYRDVDIAVEGVKAEDFFSLYGELIFALSKPIDLVDLKEGDRFSSSIREEALAI